jgi:hypothetical protein
VTPASAVDFFLPGTVTSMASSKEAVPFLQVHEEGDQDDANEAGDGSVEAPEVRPRQAHRAVTAPDQGAHEETPA